MHIKNEYIQLDSDYGLVQSTMQIIENVQFIFFEETQDASIIINDQDINVNYTQELADIIANLHNYTAEQLLIALAQQGDRRVS